VDNEPMPNADNHTVPTDPAVMDVRIHEPRFESTLIS
jgi:hypothetical protein